MPEYTMDTYLRKMPPRAYNKLSCLLDPGGLWEKFATKIPLRLTDLEQENAQPRYSMQDMQVFALLGQKAGMSNSPTQRILNDWGTKNVQIKHLIQVLVRAQMYQAANYLHDELLLQGPIQNHDQTQPPEEPNQVIADSDSKKNHTECHSSPTCVPGECSFCGGHVDEMGTMSLHVSCSSDAAPSVLQEEAVPWGQVQRNHSVSEDREEAWIGLVDIHLQIISYKMLETVTNGFNDSPLLKDKDGKLSGGNLIGSGGFGRVYLGKFHNGFKIAVKSLVPSDQIKKEDLIKQFENEVKMLSGYRHENVVHLLGYSIDGPTPCLVYQYLPNGSLEDRLAQLQDTPPILAETRIKIVKGTARGIRYLNDNKYVHRDIKSANILLDSDFNAKVGDFATVITAPSGNSTTVALVSVVIGTPAYLAPEAVQFDISTKLDSYSFGVVLLEVISGLPAHDPKREERDIASHFFENVEDVSEIWDYVDKRAGDWNEGTVEKLYDIACRCLERSKKKRPNIVDIQPELEEL